MKLRRHFWLLMLGFPGVVLPADEQLIEKLVGFTKLFGYVRYFHPTDAAASLDWERLAILGSYRILNTSNDDFPSLLAELFGPATFGMRFDEGAVPAQPYPVNTGLPVVAWQHRGVGIGGSAVYRSVRSNRNVNSAPATGSFGQSIDATPFQGREFRWTAALRADTEDADSGGDLWVRVQRANGESRFINSAAGRKYRESQWSIQAITGDIDEDATALMIGAFLSGHGTLRVDATELAMRNVDGNWEPVPLRNPSFELTEIGPAGWFAASPEYQYSIEGSEAAWHGRRSLVVSSIAPAVPGAQFVGLPAPGETVRKALGDDLFVTLPIALDSSTAAAHKSLPVLHAELGQLDERDLDRSTLSVAGVMITWNVMQHFYPYFDVVDTDWDAALIAAFRNALDDQTVDDHRRTLARLMAELDDGHGSVWHESLRGQSHPPLRVRWIEEQVVVVATDVPDIVRPGDVIVAIDGRPAAEYVAEKVSYLSGALRWKRFKALQSFSPGLPGSQLQLTVSRDDEQFEVTVERGHWVAEPRGLDPVDIAAPGIHYVDLGRVEEADLQAAINDLAAADALIVDMRGYPRGTHWFLSHMSDQPLQSARWNVPLTIYPDRVDLAGWNTAGRWLMAPRKPRLPVHVVFLTDASAISYAESVMGIVEHYQLGEIIGEATAGTNGNVNPFSVPGDMTLSWTGMKVLKHDGSQHHLVGIQPSIPVGRTVTGVRAGRDEILDAGIATLRRLMR